MTELQRARFGVATVFVLNGYALATLLSRVPAIRDTLGFSPGQLGLLLLTLSLGTVIALPLSGLLVHHAGAARAVAGGALTVAIAFVVLTVGLSLASAPLVATGLLVYGVGTSTWDVAMNVEGAAVERGLRRTLLPRLHAGFSIGTVLGALLGAAAARVGLGLPLQLAVAAPLLLVVVGWAVRTFLPAAEDPHGDGSARTSVLAAWRDRRTLALGLLVLAFALAEGIANDWLALALVDGHGARESTGALGYATFVAAMTLGRFAGGWLVDGLGRVPVLRVSALLAVCGVVVLVTAGSLALVWVGVALWGLGASLGFPLGMSAAGDDPAHAAARVSVVASLGYTAFLAGPPLVGFLADEAGILSALLVVPVAALLGVLAAPSTREPEPTAEATR